MSANNGGGLGLGTARKGGQRGSKGYGSARQETCNWCLVTFYAEFGYVAVYCCHECRMSAKYYRRYWRKRGCDISAKMRERHLRLIAAQRDEYARMPTQPTRHSPRLTAPDPPVVEPVVFTGFGPADTDALLARIRGKWGTA